MDGERWRAEKRASDAGRELGRLGATKGGRARADALSPAERSEIARRAVQTRWARAAVVEGAKSHALREDETCRSRFRGTVDFGPAEVECHVLDRGARVLTGDQLLLALGAGDRDGNPLRQLRRIVEPLDQVLARRAISFRTSAEGELVEGYEIAVLVDLCERILTARDAGLLKKKQLRWADSAEAVVRRCSRAGVDALVDEGTGYDRIRTRQMTQLRLQALIADETEEWVRIVPAEFWAQLARLEGRRVVPDRPPMAWSSYVMAFVYDAVEPDVGRELRRHTDGAPRFAPDPRQWLLATGRKRLPSQMRQVIVTMNGCADIGEFRAAFAKVLLKGPLHLQMLEDAWPGPTTRSTAQEP
jgi:hypothetical protein